jgi:uncharacterized protein (TIGR03083 family)
MTMSTGEPVLVLDRFAEVRERLIALLRGLTDEHWAMPTVCAGWTVHDVALHLLGVNVSNVSRRRDGFGGNFAAFVPPGGDLADERTLATTLNAWNETWVLATRRISPRMLPDLLDATARQLEAYLETLDLFATGDAVSWAGPEPAPVWLDVAREYTEQWTHQAQIRDAVGAPLLDEPHLFAPVLAAFMHALPHTLRDLVRPTGTTLLVEILGPAGGIWAVARDDERWRFTDPEDVAPNRVRFDQDTAWRLVTKGLVPGFARKRTTIVGDEELGEEVLRMVSIIA